MKENIKIKIISILVIILILIFLNNNKKDKSKDYEYITQEFSYNIDMDNLSLLKRDTDEVTVGTVIEQKETEYIGSSSFKDENENVTTIDGIPFTNFSVKIEQVIKGELSSGDIVNIKKHGGESQSDENLFYLDDGGFFPEVGKKYIIFSNYQEDGSLLSIGKNTMIEYSENKMNELKNKE